MSIIRQASRPTLFSFIGTCPACPDPVGDHVGEVSTCPDRVRTGSESNLTSITDANTRKTAFTYDSNRRLTRTTFPSTLAENYTYDLAGNLQDQGRPQEPDHYLHLRPVEPALAEVLS